ncbi:MAG: precorrin-8X methylmutase [Syntrophaceticus schinkii]
MIIGTPVGFVDAAESKARLLGSGSSFHYNDRPPGGKCCGCGCGQRLAGTGAG